MMVAVGLAEDEDLWFGKYLLMRRCGAGEYHENE
jgi:hypothetical protein